MAGNECFTLAVIDGNVGPSPASKEVCLGHQTRQDDLTLAREAQSGRPEAFDLLVERHQDRVYGVIHRMVNDREKAMDLTQEAFLRAWRGLGTFGGQSAFFTWLYRIARNVVMSAGRYEAARPKIRVSLDEPARGGDAESGRSRIDPEDTSRLPGESLLVREQRDLVVQAIGSLPSEFREIVILRDMRDQSYEEIADLLDIPLGTVRSRLHRARMELKERLRSVFDPTT